MKGRTTVFAIALIIVALLVSFPSVKQGALWWDEAVYLGLADNLYEHQTYDVNAKIHENFRAPLFPLLIASFYALFGHQNIVPYLINPMMTVAIALAIFFTGKRMYDETTGFLASILVITNGQYIFWSSKILSEPLAILLATFVLFGAYKAIGEKNRIYYLLLFPALALAFLTRYPLAALGIAVAFYGLILRRGKILSELKTREFLAGTAGFVAILLPWILFNYRLFGNPIGGALKNLTIVQSFHHSPWIFVTEFFPNLQFLGILAIVGILTGFYRWEKRAILMNCFIIISFAIFMFVLGQKEFRYVIITLPAMAFLASDLLMQADRKLELRGVLAVFAAALIVSLGVHGPYEKAYHDKDLGISLRSAAEYLDGRVNEGESVMTQNYPLFSYLSNAYVVYFPADVWGVNEFIERFNITYVVVDSLNYYPSWSPEYFEKDPRFLREAAFADEISNATVYHYLGQKQDL